MRKNLSIKIVMLACLVWGAALNAAQQQLPPLPDFPEFPAPLKEIPANISGEVYFESHTPYDFDVLLHDFKSARKTTALGTLFLPKQASADKPVPAMVLLHGSGGIAPGREMEYGQLLADKGYAALIVDYYLPRGVTEKSHYMTKVLSVTEFDVVTDAYAALRFLNQHPAIDGQRVGVMGFSYGGMATRLTMDERIRQVLASDLPSFALHVDYYGPCHQDFAIVKTSGGSLLSLRGAADASNDLSECAIEEAKLRKAGSEVSSVIYSTAGHAWEVNRPRALSESSPYVTGCKLVYNEQGKAAVNGKQLSDVPLQTSREKRYLLRAASGEVMQACVQYGYIIGRDEAVKQRSDRELLEFMAREFDS